MKVSRFVSIRNSSSAIFLNCTKNIELTPRAFPRTVFFAPLDKNQEQTRSKTTTRLEMQYRPVGNEPPIHQTSPFLNDDFKPGWLPMKATNRWITYRTRFLVKAKQLNSSLTFTDTLGRQHSGRKGDYLVESSDGVLRIAPRQIFEDIYVPLMVGEGKNPETVENFPSLTPLPQPLTLRKRAAPASFSIPPHLARKSPQPCHDRSSPSPGLRSF